MQSSTIPDLVRKYFGAYNSGDRQILEEGLTEDFTFTSPYDDNIDRATYFERCWPNHDKIRLLQIEKMMVDGNEAFVRYQVESASGSRFRNTELLTFRGDQLARVEVYFGDPPEGVTKKGSNPSTGAAKA
jgi:ketosteroid isomerase-like protein